MGTQPPIHTQLRCCVVWFNFTIRRRGGVSVVQTCPVTPRLCKHTHWLAHTHTNVAPWLKKAGCGPSGVFMIWHHQSGWWSAVSCFVWFSSTNCSSTNASSGKTRQERLWLVRAGPHMSCQSCFQHGNANLVTDKVLCWPANGVMESAFERKMKRPLIAFLNWSQGWWKARSGVGETFSPLHSLNSKSKQRTRARGRIQR